MAAELPKLTKNYFFVYAPDVPNAQRAKHLAVHMVQNTPLLKDGTISESIDDVWAQVKKDVFYTSGEVWDRSKIIVKPAFLALQDVRFE
ncbi:hypothetical protein C8Q73DRAFT_794226 [Cubamyces lactineus]|nr:hypothetical protein C8Q73DRAFT_794226 [Cubamyces lactineus]